MQPLVWYTRLRVLVSIPSSFLKHAAAYLSQKSPKRKLNKRNRVLKLLFSVLLPSIKLIKKIERNKKNIAPCFNAVITKKKRKDFLTIPVHYHVTAVINWDSSAQRNWKLSASSVTSTWVVVKIPDSFV